MNRLILIIFILMSFFKVDAQVVKHVDASEFKKLVDAENGIILDVRTQGEVARGHIKGTSVIDIADREFVSKLNMMQKDKPIYVYCLTGSRSRTAARIMEQNGFKEVYNLAQGVVSWYRSGYPLVAEQVNQAESEEAFTPESIKKLINTEGVVLVDFNASWCAPCKTMLPVVDKLATENQNKLDVLKVDISENQEIAQLYNVKSVPSFVLFKNGEKIWHKTGVMSYDDLNSAVNNHIN